MFKRCALLGCIVMIVVWNQATYTHAAQPSTPLILLISADPSMSGDLWEWTGPNQPMKQLTKMGYDVDPVISPDGSQVAYNSYPQFIVDDIKANGPHVGYDPTNISVLSLDSGASTQVADQPPGAPKSSPGWLRPPAAWSPDGQSLSWGEVLNSQTTGEISPDQFQEQLVIYNLKQKSQQVIVKNFPGTQGITSGDTPAWNEHGMAFLNTSGVNGDDSHPVVYLYDATGKQLSKVVLDVQADCPCDQAYWVKDGNKDAIAVSLQPIDNTQTILLIDPDTGNTSKVAGRIELYSPSAADSLFAYTMGTNEGGQPIWRVGAPGKPDADLDASETPAISPDGQQIAYINSSGQLELYQNGQAAPVMLGANQTVRDVAWSPLAWRFHRS